MVEGGIEFVKCGKRGEMADERYDHRQASLIDRGRTKLT